ncbi:MAG: MBL fold metallo-hydrolase [Tistlia sp.]|uniref:MBL fold metallo-hydrolase RNA specificity domain-containing protein n=1 Tax=Tistlia sp. TaxID=3057121 RepID=UPI0034A49F91
MAGGRLPPARVFLDSPLAIKATEVFEAYAGDLVDLRPGATPFRGPGFAFTPRPDQSQRLSRITEGAIIVAASGMCDAGRIRHHLKSNLWRRNATVLFVGYQAPGTLGNILLGGARKVRIHGEEIAVQARIRRIDAYSAHADQRELLEWVAARLPVAQAIFLTHGEQAALRALKHRLVETGLDSRKVIVPRLDERVELVASGRVRLRPDQARAAPRATEALDWHNDYADLLLTLGDRLQALPDDAAREALLHDLKRRTAAG